MAFLVKALGKCWRIFTTVQYKTQELEEANEYSVFNEMPAPGPRRPKNAYQHYVYFIFAAWFLIQAVLHWMYFIAFRKRAVSDGLDAINQTTLPYLISAISLSVILIASLILFFRKSMRASIALLIFGAILELLIFYFFKPY